jgi:threonine aldolase
MATKKKSQTKSQETTLRHLWLAGLGLVAVTRREAISAANDAASKMESFKRQAEQLARQTQASIAEGLANTRQQGEAKVEQFSADMEARLAPVLVKLGLKPQPTAKPRARKPAKKASAQRTRSTATRKPAAKRTVRKNRA